MFPQDDSTGEMIFDEVFHALSRCLAGLAQPFQVPGTDQLFRPKIFITILAYSSIVGLASHQVWSLGQSSCIHDDTLLGRGGGSSGKTGVSSLVSSGCGSTDQALCWSPFSPDQ